MKPTILEKDVPIHNQILAKCFNNPVTMDELAWIFQKSRFYACLYVKKLIKAGYVTKEKSNYKFSLAKYVYTSNVQSVPSEAIISEADRHLLDINAPHDTANYQWLGNPFREGVRV